MCDDKIVRQLEVFINSGGDIKLLKSRLSVSGTDEEFLSELNRINSLTKCIVCGKITEEINGKVCNKCASEYKFE